MKSILVCIMSLVSFNLFSQQIGIKGGFMFCKIQELNGWINPSGGVFITSNGNLYFNGEVNYKNISGTDIVSVNDLNEYSFKYIEIPLLIGIKRKSTYINMGMIPSFIFSSKLNSKDILGAESFNLSICLSPGVMIDDRLSLEARVSNSFSGIYKTTFNYFSASLLLGYRIKK